MDSIKVTREEVQGFLSIQTPIFDYFCGAGYGDGDGVGNSCVENGYECSYGFCDGDGYGDGAGSGNIYGSGSGAGYGSVGYDYGDIKALNGYIVDYIDYVPSIITQVHGNLACGYIVKKDLSLDSCFIAKVGNSFAHGKTLKDAVADAEAKEMEKSPIEERIEKFIEVFGPLNTEHNGKEFYDWHHILTGSCRMGRDEFCRSHNIDLEKKYTVGYFLQITKEAYGGDVIKLIREAYENKGEIEIC